MEKIEFECPICENKNSLILMGYDKAEFEKKCLSCKTDLEIIKTEDELKINPKKNIQKKEFSEEEKKGHGKVPVDYKLYSSDEPDNKTALIIAILILTSSLMGISTGWSLTNAFELDYSEYEKINLEIVVQNNTSDLDNVTIIFNNDEVNYTYEGNGSYNILVIPGDRVIPSTIKGCSRIRKARYNRHVSKTLQPLPRHIVLNLVNIIGYVWREPDIRTLYFPLTLNLALLKNQFNG